MLSCSCFVGVYEMYNGQAVWIVEEAGAACPNPWHQPGRVVERPSGTPMDGDRPSSSSPARVAS
jgi:hypothetical protein